MAGLRTAADVSAEYTAARDSYLKALAAQTYSISTGGGSTSVSRASVDMLKDQMDRLSAEYAALSRGGIRIRGATLVG